MIQKSVSLEHYLTRKVEFTRRRRKVRLGFDKLYSLLSSDISFNKIAIRAGISRARVKSIFDLYYRDLFQESGLQRRCRRERTSRAKKMNRVNQIFSNDRVMKAIIRSASKAKRKRKIEPIICKKGQDASKIYHHRAVLVDGANVEMVHHIQTARFYWFGGVTYGTTTLSRRELERSRWTIFYVDVPSYRPRIIRSRNSRLLKALFPRGIERKNVYIPLVGIPENPVYDFLADQNNWT